MITVPLPDTAGKKTVKAIGLADLGSATERSQMAGQVGDK